MFYFPRPRYIVRGTLLLDVACMLLRGRLIPFSTAATVLVAQSVIYISWIYWIYPYFFSPLRQLPCPPESSIPLLGHFPKLLQVLSHPDNLEKWISSFRHGPIGELPPLVRFEGFFHSEGLIANTVAAMQEVLTHRTNDWVKPRASEKLARDILGKNSILFTEGDVHRIQRKALQPAFSSSHLNGLSGFFAKRGAKLAAVVKQHVLAEELDVGDYVSAAILDTIGLAACDQDFGALHNPNNELARLFKTMFGASNTEQLADLIRLIVPVGIMRHLPFEVFRRRARAAHILRSTALKQIEDLAKTPRVQETIASLALKSSVFTATELTEQMLTLLIAGYETTASAMLWAVLELSHNEATQLRLREDAIATKKRNENPGFVTAFCNEVLRRYPPVPVVAREAARDTVLCGQLVPRGTSILLPIWTVNTSTDLWGLDATTFNPQRWIDDPKMGGAIDRYSFQTFSKGARSCIGERFARLELEAFVKAWVVAFKTVAVDAGKDQGVVSTSVGTKPKAVKIRVEAW